MILDVAISRSTLRIGTVAFLEPAPSFPRENRKRCGNLDFLDGSGEEWVVNTLVRIAPCVFSGAAGTIVAAAWRRG